MTDRPEGGSLAGAASGSRAKTRIRWIRPARQARSLETHERILDAAEELIADKGFDDVPVAEIARRAGFSVGAVYARFRDKAALLHCLLERFASEVRATADAAFDPAPLAGRRRGGDRGGADQLWCQDSPRADRNPARRAGTGVQRSGDRSADRASFLPTCARSSSPCCSSASTRSVIQSPSWRRASRPRLVLGLLKEVVLFAGPGAYGVPRSDDRLARELTRALLGYLGVERPPDDGLAPHCWHRPRPGRVDRT